MPHTDRREHRSPKPRTRTVHVEQPPRCHPTLFARFENERLVQLEHRHLARRSEPTGMNDHLDDRRAASQGNAPLDAGCRGECVGRRDVLPLSYLNDEGTDHEGSRRR